MKAVIFKEYGAPSVFKMVDVEKPTPNPNEVLIKIDATSVTAAEVMMRKSESFMSRLILGFKGPGAKYQILGLELSGEIESVGDAVNKFKIGDEVYGFTGFKPGAYAEYKCMPENASLCLKPKKITHEQAAIVVDGASTALFFLEEKAKIKKDEKVLIIGASGSIGAYAVQLATYFGTEVTGVCSSKNEILVKSLGANNVIDYNKEDYTKKSGTYDIIFDTVGKSSYSDCKKILNDKGRYIRTNGAMIKNYIHAAWSSMFGRKKFIFAMSVDKRDALVFIKKLIEEGKLKPVLDKTFSIENIVEAHEYVEKGHKVGNVAININ